MIYLEIVFKILLTMTAVYVIFNIKDFLITWWRWIKITGAGIWKLIITLWEMMMGWIGRR